MWFELWSVIGKMSVQEIAIPNERICETLGPKGDNKRFQEQQDLTEQAVFRSKGRCRNYRVMKKKRRRKLCSKTFDFRDVTVFRKAPLQSVFGAH